MSMATTSCFLTVRSIRSFSETPKLSGIRKLILDFERLSYISSAGLRLLLKIQNVLEDEESKMTIRNVNEIVSDVFEVTGFVDFLNIE